MTLSPDSGTDPALPQRPDYLDFDPRARALLSRLDRHGFRGLAIQARHFRDQADESGWPTDPAAALQGARDALRRPVAEEVEDPLYEATASVRLVVALLNAADELERDDCVALEWLLTRALRLMQHQAAGASEAGRRLWAATEPGRQFAARASS